MILKIGNTEDSQNIINKTFVIGEVMNITLRNDFNILDPEITLIFNDAETAINYNYLELPELNKKYFVVSSEMVNDRVVKFNCTIDILESYKSDILTSDYSFNRGIKAGDYNGDSLPQTSYKTISKHESSKTFNSGISQIMVTVGGYENE